VPIIRHHHERWDGSGYPDGLAGDAIPRLAQIFQVLDIFDALTHARPYKPAFSVEDSLTILAEEVARGWRDPALVAQFYAFLGHPPSLSLLETPLRMATQRIRG
jgi:putative two-component system response regulator